MDKEDKDENEKVLAFVTLWLLPHCSLPSAAPEPRRACDNRARHGCPGDNRPARRRLRRRQPLPRKRPSPAAEDYTQATREETVIFDIDGGRVADPRTWNPFVPGNRRDHGFHQA